MWETLTELKIQGDAFKQKERHGCGLKSNSDSYGGRCICESVRGNPTKKNGIAIAVTAVDASNVRLF